MDLIEFIGGGICHRSPMRTFPGAWLCFRCTALYGTAFLGVVLSARFARRFGLAVQVTLCALLILPVVVENLLLRSWAPLDHTIVRVMTGALAGVGLGLFLGARGVDAIRWPEVPEKVANSIWIGCLVVTMIGAGALGLGVPVILDLVAFGGVVAIALVSTAWALEVIVIGGRFVVKRGDGVEKPRFRLALLSAFVVGELVLFAALPAHLRPSHHWIRALMG